MSLRSFHIVFIFVAALMFFGTAVWSLILLRDRDVAATILGVISVVLGLALSVYGVFFIRKAKKLIL